MKEHKSTTAGFFGFKLFGNRPGSAGSSVRDETIIDCYYSGSTEGTSVNYYGKQAAGSTNLATVAFVENAVSNPPAGTFSIQGPMNITGTSVDNTNTGNTDACINFTSTSSTSGAVICKSGYTGSISMGIGSPQSVRDLNGSLCIRINGSSSTTRYAEYYGKLIDLTYPPSQYTRNYMTNVGQLYDVTNDLRNSTLSATNATGAVQGTNYATIQQTAIEIQNPFSGLADARGFTLIGRTLDQPTNPSAMMLKVEHRDSSGGADYIQYYGETSDDNALQTKESVLALIQSEGGTPDTFQTLNLSGGFNFTSSGTQVASVKGRVDFRTFNGLGTQAQYSALYIEADSSNSNYGVVRFGGRTRYASQCQTYFEGDQHVQLNNKKLNYYDGTTITDSAILLQIDPVNDRVRVNGTMYGAAPQGSYGLYIDGSDVTTNQLWTTANPATFAIKAASGNTGGQHNVHVFGGLNGNAYALRLSKNSGSSSSDLESAIYANCDATGKVKVQAYTDWGNSYANVDTLPDSTIVTLGVLKAKGILTTATYSSTGSYNAETDADTLASTQSAVSIPAQCTFESPSGGGNGFTVLGTTPTDTNNTSAKILQTFHTPNAASEILYAGDTSDASSLQTKTSVNSLISSATSNLSTLPDNWNFYNHNTANTSSQLTGYWLLQWAVDSKTAIVIIKATNDSADGNITNGTYVSNIPNAIKPGSVVVVRLASRDGMTTADAVISPTNGYIIIRNVQGSGNTRLEGQLIYSLHDE